MKTTIIIAIALATLGSGVAAPSRGLATNLNLTVTRSRSGQFMVFGDPSTTLASRFPGVATNLDFIALEPTLLAVSCERIKESLYRELNAPASWHGKIILKPHETFSANESITIITERDRGAWNYRVELPDVLERNRFVEAIVQVLLLEMANRNAARSAEIPGWLADGLSRQLLALSEMEIILPPPRFYENGVTVTRVSVNQRKPNPLAEAQQVLNSHPPLTFQELSWPTDEQLSGDGSLVYRSCAQLFVAQLLRVKNGPECLRSFLEQLPQRLNWQLAFDDAFRSQFPKLIDVEKWWALQVVQFTGRDLTQLWTYEESLKKMDDALRAPVQVRMNGNDAPLSTSVSLQNVIGEWDRVRQYQTLQRKLWELSLLRMHVAQELAPLVDEYRQTLQAYLQKRNFSGTILARKRRTDLRDKLADETAATLDALDAQRAVLRPEPGNSTNHPRETAFGTGP
jgi:hypothetical protein